MVNAVMFVPNKRQQEHGGPERTAGKEIVLCAPGSSRA